MNGRGCSECGGTKLITNQKFIDDANKKHNNIYNYDKTLYENSSSKVIINCKIHGDFKQIAYDHVNGCGCPKCKSSTGEKMIIEVLKKMNLKFKHQYKFDECVHKSKLLFDFAVFKNDKVKLIEFHGRQHYDYISFFHKKNGREESILRDKIKLDYARVNKIDLLVIPYTLQEDIEPLLIDFLT